MTPAEFSLTERQREATRLLAGPARHTMLYGGSRSGKSFVLMRATVMRAAKAAKSTHAVFRFRFAHLKASLIRDTFPKVMRLCFPQLQYVLNKTDWFVELSNGSQILFGGLDDKERVERILGQEHSTIWFEECSQISYAARNLAVTRLAQDSGLKLKAYYSQNPPTVAHWGYKLFELKTEPREGAPLPDPQNYVSLLMNPADNRDNLPDAYFEILDGLPSRDRMRFRDGRYMAAIPGALWSAESFARNRLPAPATEAQRDAVIERMQRVVIAVDPSGCAGPEDERSDEIGIVAVGLDRDGAGCVLEDLSGRYSPDGWARAALYALDRWRGDRIVGERNFGGAMVESTIRAARPTAPVVLVTASRGKAQRAEPVAALYEQGRVKHMGVFPDLEEQLCNFSTSGYQGARSPDRADAAIWGLTSAVLEGGAPNPLHLWARLGGA